MAFDTSKLKSSLNKAPKKEKILHGLAVATLVSTFLPWMTIPFFGGSLGGVSGFNSVGFLSFLGALVYLLWRIFPMAGMKVPNSGMSDAMSQKVLAGVMLAGPALWIIQSGFAFGMFGYGLWIALAASAAFAYMTFTK